VGNKGDGPRNSDEFVISSKDVGYATGGLFVTFTAARRARKTTAVEFTEVAHWPNRQGMKTVAPHQAWISQNPTNLDVVAPIKARACDALQAVLKSKPRPVGADSRIMRRGIERC
jgi:hypothetical protein